MFSQEDHDRYDLKARSAIKKIFLKSKIEILDFADVYPDISKNFMCADLAGVINGKHVFNIEVEISNRWIPYVKDGTHITFLKEKVYSWQNPEFTLNKPTHWVLFDNMCDNHLFVHHNNIIKSIFENQWHYIDTKNRGLRRFLLISKDYIKINALHKLRDQLDS